MQGASPKAVNRIVCYCDDCQAFAHHLGRADLLDESGGTDIVQVAPASVRIERGDEHVVGVRLGPKGLYRFYAECCKTPLGNTVSPVIPFLGIVAQAFESPDAQFGKPTAAILGKYAVGGPPEGSTGLNLRFIGRVVRKLLFWKLRGRGWPHPYFDRATGRPSRPLTILSRAEREALRPSCGPIATSVPAR